MSTAEQPRVSRGLLIALGGVVGLAVLAAVWFFVVSPLLEDDPTIVPVAGDQDDQEPTPEPVETPTPEPEPPPETDEFFTARDPFQQLVQPAVATTGDSGDDSDDSGDDSDDSDDGDEPASGVRVGQTSVRLVEVAVGTDGVTRVHVEVNGEAYAAAENERFAERFQVLDISGDCATFLFGDNRFTLCEGETIRK